MLTADVIALIGLEADWKTVTNLAQTCRKARKTLNDPSFWRIKLQKDFGYVYNPNERYSAKEAYNIFDINVPADTIFRAAGLGWVAIVQHCVENYAGLDLRPAMKIAFVKGRKNVSRYFRRIGAKPLTNYELFAHGL